MQLHLMEFASIFLSSHNIPLLRDLRMEIGLLKLAKLANLHELGFVAGKSLAHSKLVLVARWVVLIVLNLTIGDA